jgi:type IV secretory pathway component VirB8
MSGLTRLAPWRAQPLSDAAKSAHSRRLMDLRAESVLLGRSAIIAGWVVGGIGAAAFFASMVGWLTVLPLKTTEMRFFEVDRSTGIIGVPVSLEDAPKLFSEATDHQYLKRYLQACEQWIWEMDRQNDHVCKLMSTPERQARYMAWREKPSSPPKSLGRAGYIEIDNLRYHLQAVDKLTNTHRYWVQYDRAVWKGQTKDQMAAWSATVDFQYHPELPMLPRDRPDNLSGMQVSGFTVSSDAPYHAEVPK